MRKITCFLLVMCLLVPGCAFSGKKDVLSSRAGAVAGTGGDVDEEALRTFMALYNAAPETQEDMVAKRIALDKMISELKRKNPACLEKAGVFLPGYPKENVREWTNSKLEDMYRAVGTEAVIQKRKRTSGQGENEAVLTEIRMAAREEVVKEKRRRDTFRNMLGVSCNLVKFLLRFAIPI